MQLANTREDEAVARTQLGVHFEISRRQSDAVADLAGCAIWEREGYAVELLAVLHVRDPNFHDLLMRGGKLYFHVYLARNVGEYPEGDHSASAHRNRA